MAEQKRRRKPTAPKGSQGKTDKDPELVALGQRLGELRRAAGLTQEALAHTAGLHWTYIGQIERGERNLSYKNFLKLARGLGVKPGQLIPKA